MLKSIAAIAFAIVIADSLALTPEITAWAGAGASPQRGVKGDRLDIREIRPAITPACSQEAWPHYDSRCVRDRTRPTGHPRDVRIVTIHRLPVTAPAASTVN
jgi:hypothetical protein